MIRLQRSIVGLVLALPEGRGSDAQGLPTRAASHTDVLHVPS